MFSPSHIPARLAAEGLAGVPATVRSFLPDDGRSERFALTVMEVLLAAAQDGDRSRYIYAVDYHPKGWVTGFTFGNYRYTFLPGGDHMRLPGVENFEVVDGQAILEPLPGTQAQPIDGPIDVIAAFGPMEQFDSGADYTMQGLLLNGAIK